MFRNHTADKDTVAEHSDKHMLTSSLETVLADRSSNWSHMNLGQTDKTQKLSEMESIGH